MVSVDQDLDPPEEAKIKSEPMGVPTSAPPKEALAERAGARGTSADVLPEEGYGEAEGIAYAIVVDAEPEGDGGADDLELPQAHTKNFALHRPQHSPPGVAAANDDLRRGCHAQGR